MFAITDPLAPDESTPSLAPPKAMRLETDTFCEHCHYNLFGQAVTVDPRLQIMICRCPECGRFHPAGRGVSASRVWLNRFGMFMLVVWVLFCLLLVSLGSFILGGMQYTFLERFTVYVAQTPDGQPVERNYSSTTVKLLPPVVSPTTVQPPARATISSPYNYNNAAWVIEGTDEVVPVVVYKRVVDYHYHWREETPTPLWQVLMPYVLVSAIDALILGLLFSVAFWHWKRRAYFSLLLPVAVGTFIFTIWRTQRGVDTILAWSIGHIALWSLFDMAILAVGLIFGRRIARLIVSVVLPAKPRQHFAFLWAADGKKWPFPQTSATARKDVLGSLT